MAPILSSLAGISARGYGMFSGKNIQYLVVAGGAGGGQALGVFPLAGTGGGGAGGLLNGTTTYNTGNTFTITVGGPGAQDANGNNSVFGTVTAIAGGKGGKSGSINGTSGGSGGGGHIVSGTGGGFTAGQGSTGGSAGATSGDFGGGGGGGAGGAGGSAGSGSAAAGAGGAGLSLSISGSSVSYANGGAGGTGGVYTTPVTGAANTGNGGGGGTDNLGVEAAGGSGVVILSYSSELPDLASIGVGLTFTLTTSGGNKIYQFTAGTGSVTI